MKKIIIGTLVICIIWILPIVGNAEPTSVPHFLNYQSLLYDDGGNLLPDGQADVTFKVTDAAGSVLFEEHQTVDVVRGAVSALVGNGLDSGGAPMGGIPASVLSPDSGRYLEVTVDGYPPEAGLEIVSVPYSIYAEKALAVADEGVTGAMLAKKSITIDHLADGLISDLATQMGTAGLIATRTDLTNLQTTYRSTTGASTIGVTSGLVYSGSNNLQGVLQDLDRAVQHRQAGIDAVQDNITSETGARQVADTTLQTNINAEASARASGDTTLQTNLNAHASTNISTAHPNGTFPISRLNTDIATQTELNSEASTRSIADTAEASARATADTDEATARAGVQSNLDTHTASTSAHGSDGAVLGKGAVFLSRGWATDNAYVGVTSNFSDGECAVITSVGRAGPTGGIDAFCTNACRRYDPGTGEDLYSYRIRCWWDGDQNDGTGCESINSCEDGTPGQGELCERVSYMIVCVDYS